MSTQYTTPFREFIARDDQGRYHVRLGPQTFSTNYKFTDIRLETENGGTPVDPEYLKGKPWILRNLKQEVDKQRTNERKAMYAKDCFQRTPYSQNQKIAYKNARSN
jgi:hypothetical protein